MKENSKKIIPIMVMLLTLVTLSKMPVFAEEDSAEDVNTGRQDRVQERQLRVEERQQEREDRIEENKEKRMVALEEMTKKRCENRAMRVENKIKMFETSAKFHQEKYEKFTTRLETLIGRLKEKDYDTTTLEADVEMLNTKVTTLKEKFQVLMSTLEDIKNQECPVLDENGKPVKTNNSLEQSKEALTAVREAAKDVQTYIKETVRPDLKELIDQVKEDREEKRAEDENSTETN